MWVRCAGKEKDNASSFFLLHIHIMGPFTRSEVIVALIYECERKKGANALIRGLSIQHRERNNWMDISSADALSATFSFYIFFSINGWPDFCFFIICAGHP